MSQVHVFKMEMTCEECPKKAKQVLGELGDKVSDVQASYADKTVTVTSSLDEATLLEELKKTGKAVSKA